MSKEFRHSPGGREEFERRPIHGRWFLPEAPEKEHPGTLQLTSDGVELDLNGILSPKDPLRQEYPDVLGHSAEGTPITLQDVWRSGGMYHTSGYAVARCEARRAYLGKHLTDIGGITFQAFRVQVGSQQEFIGFEALALHSDDGRHSVIATTPPVLDGSFDEFTLRIYELLPAIQIPFAEVTLRQEAVFHFTCSPPLAISEFERGPLRTLHTLVEFAAGGPVPLLSVAALDGPQADSRGQGLYRACLEGVRKGHISVPDQRHGAAVGRDEQIDLEAGIRDAQLDPRALRTIQRRRFASVWSVNSNWITVRVAGMRERSIRLCMSHMTRSRSAFRSACCSA